MKLKYASIIPQAVMSAILFSLATSARAGFQYNPRDLVFGFRVDGGGTWEMTVNAGPAATFYSLPVGRTITVSNIIPSVLMSTFGDVNNLAWSAAADVRTTGDATFPIDTDWVTQQRTDLNTQTTPWPTRSPFAQAIANTKIDGIAGAASDLGAFAYGNLVPGGPTNTATLIVIPGGLSPYAYSVYMGNGNYGNGFPGNVEASTGPTLTTDGQVVRADLYQLKPSSPNGAGTYLGYFEFNTNGVMTYTSGPSGGTTVPRPSITGVTRVGTTTTVTFTTVSGAQYSLRTTNNAGLKSAVSTWPISGAPVSGTGTTQSITDSTGDAQRYYSISAH